MDNNNNIILCEECQQERKASLKYPNICIECRKKIYKKEWNLKNRETIKIKRDKYKWQNQEKIKQKNKKYREKNKELINNKQSLRYQKTKNEISFKRKFTIEGRYKVYKNSINSKKFGFHLTIEEFKQFWGQTCFYCNRKIKTIGLDRVDSKKGYQLDNIVSCCKTCNLAKGNLEQNFFLDWIMRMRKFRNKT